MRGAPFLLAVYSLAVLFAAFSEAAPNCQAGKVTCCMTIDNALYKVLVDGVDVTANVQPQTAFLDWRIAKTITFDEPMYTATLAIQGFEYNADVQNEETSGMQLTCVSTRRDSPWNFVSQPDANWTSVAPIKRNRFPDNWHSTSFSGAVGVVESRAVFELDWSGCTAAGIPKETVARSRRVAATTNQGVFSFIRTVRQDPVCAVAAPDRGQRGSARQDDGRYCGSVTCCLTVDNELISVFVNGRNVTSSLIPGDELSLGAWRATKRFTFTEPDSSSKIVLGVLGKDWDETHGPAKSGIQVMCTASRSNSRWNDVTTDLNPSDWHSVPQSSPDWFSLNYLGPSASAVASGSKFYIRDPICGALDRVHKVAAREDGQNSPLFALRLDLNEPSPCVARPDGTPEAVTPFEMDIALSFTVDEASREAETSKGGWAGRDVMELVQTEFDAMSAAKAYWERVITRSYPSRACIPAGTTLCGILFAQQTCFEDILVVVAASSRLDSKPAETTVCALDPVGRSRVARVLLNRQFSSSALLPNVLLHAFGHAIGLGSLWDEFNLVSASSKAYVGATVEAETDKTIALDERDTPPIHWSADAVGASELFTASVSSSSLVSRVSLLSMMDLRLEIDLSLASSNVAASTSQDGAVLTTGDVILVPRSVLSGVSIKSGRDGEAAADGLAKQRREEERSAVAAGSSASTGPLSVGTLIGIIVGAVFGIAAIGLAMYVVRERRKRGPPRSGSARAGSVKRPSGRGAAGGHSAWVERLDEENSTTYWVNRDTGEFSWSNPLSEQTQSPKPTTQSELVVMAEPEVETRETGSDWTVEEDEASKVRYFIKPTTGEFSWTMPAEMTNKLSEQKQQPQSPFATDRKSQQ